MNGFLKALIWKSKVRVKRKQLFAQSWSDREKKMSELRDNSYSFEKRQRELREIASHFDEFRDV